MAATKMKLKLLVDKKRNKVLFAETGKELVDFLFSLLTLALGTTARLLTPTQITTGCIGNLYSSVENLDNSYIQPNANKSLLLQPEIGSGGNQMPMLLLQSSGKGNGNGNSSQSKPIYYRSDRLDCGMRCGVSTCYGVVTKSCRDFVTNTQGASCGCCGKKMMSPMYFVEGQGSTGANGGGGSAVGEGTGGGGYVKEVATYMVTDDLEVKQISGIASFNRYDFKDFGDLEDKAVHLGMKEGLDLLRASLQSKSVPADVFLNKGFVPSSSSPIKTYLTRSTKRKLSPTE